jgi:hypothetical protein
MKSFGSMLMPILVTLLQVANPVSSYPSADPQSPTEYLPSTKPGDPIIEGSRCIKGKTICPIGTFCQSTYYQPSDRLLYCLHPDRTKLLTRPPPNNCSKLEDCAKGNYCRIYNGETSGRCATLECQCGMGQNLCISGTAACEYGNWGQRGGGCLTKVGIYANCL